jgi:hypothetical protein
MRRVRPSRKGNTTKHRQPLCLSRTTIRDSMEDGHAYSTRSYSQRNALGERL